MPYSCLAPRENDRPGTIRDGQRADQRCGNGPFPKPCAVEPVLLTHTAIARSDIPPRLAPSSRCWGMTVSTFGGPVAEFYAMREIGRAHV